MLILAVDNVLDSTVDVGENLLYRLIHCFSGRALFLHLVIRQQSLGIFSRMLYSLLCVSVC